MRVFACSTTQKFWNTLGNSVLEVVACDTCGFCQSSYSDSRAIDVGYRGNSNNGLASFTITLNSYSNFSSICNQLGITLEGVTIFKVPSFSVPLNIQNVASTVQKSVCAWGFTYLDLDNSQNKLGNTIKTSYYSINSRYVSVSSDSREIYLEIV